MTATMKQPAAEIKREYMALALVYLTLTGLSFLLQISDGINWASLHTERVHQGEFWRIITAHLTHLDWPHFAMNMTGMALCLLVYRGDLPAWHWLSSYLFVSIFSSLGLLCIYEDYQRYVGFSDVLHGWILIGAAAISPREPKLALTVFVLFWLKIAEENSGMKFFTSTGIDTETIATESHLFGAIGGMLYALLFLPDFRHYLSGRIKAMFS